MRSYKRAALLGLFLAGGGVVTTGCGGGEHYRNLVDVCEYDRHNAQARQEAIMAINPQVQNGQVLDQTIWNFDFDPGTDKLNPTGQDKLLQIVRRRPAPDSRIFLATARDLAYDPAHPEQYGEETRELDAKRAAAIQKYLGAMTAGRPMAFQVDVHDPNPEIGHYAETVLRAFRALGYGATGSSGSGGGGFSGGSGSGSYGQGQQIPAAGSGAAPTGTPGSGGATNGTGTPSAGGAPTGTPAPGGTGPAAGPTQ